MLEGYKTKKIGIVRAGENINKLRRINAKKDVGKDEKRNQYK